METHCEEGIVYEKKDGIGRITICRPKKMNSITKDMGIRLNQLTHEINEDQEVKVVLLTGEGEKSFSTGSDINMLHQYGTPFELRNRLDYCAAIRNIRKPVISKVKGYALGGGLELVLATDIRIAADNSKYAVSEIQHGWISGSGATQLLARTMSYNQAAELVLTGNMIDAEEAYRLGIINKVISKDTIDEYVENLLIRLGRQSNTAMQLAKRNLRASQNMTMDEGIRFENDLFAFSFTTEDAKEGQLAFAEKRDPVFH